MKIYLVGGAVRDQLLNHPYHERDWVVVGASVKQMHELGYTPVGKDFPVFLHPETKEEYALARTERKSGYGYGGFEFNTASDVTLEQDLSRRDLTINAIAQTAAGELIDPYGGASDIENKTLRHVSDAFAEDPLRILRTARFAARYHHLGFTVAKETLALMQHMVTNGEASHLVAERVWQETYKALGEDNAHRYFQTLRQCGALAVVLPELDQLFQIPINEGQHVTSIGEQNLAILQHACHQTANDDTGKQIRFAVLTQSLVACDINKQQPQSQTSINKTLQQLCARIKLPNHCRDLIALLGTHINTMQKADILTANELLELFKSCDAMRRPERFNLLLTAVKIISQGQKQQLQDNTILNNYLASALWVSQKVSTQKLINKGFKGKALGEQLQKKRLARLNVFIHQCQKAST